jgi:transposase
VACDPGAAAHKPRGVVRIDDCGCDAQAILDLVRETGGSAHIPTRRDHKRQGSIDRGPCRRRNPVERDFRKLEHFRGMATRFANRAREFLAAIPLAPAGLWTKACPSTT